MQRACAHAFCFVLVFLFSASLCLVPTSVRADSGTITVPDDYPTIQTAINAANVGDNVFVRSATYYEDVVVNKTVLLVGESPETTIVDGGQGDSAILIVVDNVTVEGFTVKSTRHYESGTDRASVRLEGVRYCNITANTLTGGDVGVFLNISSNNDIDGNNVTTTLWPMWFTQASANNIYDNVILNSFFPIDLLSSNKNTIFNNSITGTEIRLSPLCFGNVITANNFSNTWPSVELGSDVWERSPYWWMVQNTTVTDNTFVDGGILADYTYGNTVENNTVSGKPIVYLEGVSDRKINDAGQVILINCSRVQIENLYLLNVCAGVDLREDNNITVTGNNVTGGALGFALHDTSNTNITGNTLEGGSADAIRLQSSSSNTISQNNIVDNGGYGIELQSNSNHNRVFHNSLIRNALGGNVWPNQTIIEESSGNVWDDGYPSGGNYWSDYNGTDVFNGSYQNETGSDGIGDKPYVIGTNNTDQYPLMGTFSEFNVTLPYAITESVSVVSNSTVSNLTLVWWLSSPNDGIQPGQPLILFTATGESGNVGFCMLMIPRTVLNSSSYVVLVDSHPVYATQLSTSNDASVYLYFTYTLSSHEVIVTIPEFSSLTLLLFITSTLLAVIIYGRKRAHAPSTERVT